MSIESTTAQLTLAQCQAVLVLSAYITKTESLVADYRIAHPSVLVHRLLPQEDDQKKLFSLLEKCGASRGSVMVDSKSDKCRAIRVDHARWGELEKNIRSSLAQCAA